MTVDGIIKKLELLENPENIAGMARFGILTKKAFGVCAPVLKNLAEEIKIQTANRHELALELWETGIYEARIVAYLIDDARQVSTAQMDEWANDFDNWAICDGTCGHLFRKTEFAYRKVFDWSERDEEFVKRAGIVLTARLAVHDKTGRDEKIAAFLPALETYSDDERNFIKKAVNWSLRRIGKRSVYLNERAVESALRIKLRNTESARRIASDALRESRSEKFGKDCRRKRGRQRFDFGKISFQYFNVLTPMKIFIAAVCLCFSMLSLRAQQTDSKQPVVVQPGAPGQPTKTLPATTKGKLPPRSAKDVEFMQGMIMHHGQAVEMTALIEARTNDKAVRLIGAKISQSQSDEINFMKRWLARKGESDAMPMKEMPGMDHSKMDHSGMNHSKTDHSKMDHSLMPGMLSPEQMEELKSADGAAFDRLFLKGMIQHHEGALAMVKDLFETAGAGQDAELFNFTTDVDTGQRAEIKIMQDLLDEKAKKEKR